nr:MAG TPA: Helicase, ATPase, REPLICATION [Caudoviricetes sp.]
MTTHEFEYLALIINYPDLLERNILKEEYFENKDRVMFSILLTEYKLHKEFIVGELVKHKNFDIDYFTELLNGNMFFSAKEIKFEELQKEIISKYKARRYKEIINSYNGDYEANLKLLNELNEISYLKNNYITCKDVLDSLLSEKKQVRLGYPILDESLNLSQNDLLILSAGTGIGKTSFAINLLNNLSKDYQCIYFNMEMSKEILYKRLCSLNTQITMQELTNARQLETSKKQLIVDKLRDLEERKIVLINGSTKAVDMKKYILNLKTDRPIIVFVDHIGLVKASGNSIYERTTNVVKELRAICLDCNCTMVALCQLSRGSQIMNEAPKLQDLRDSGEIEQSARKVIMLHDKDKGSKDRIHNVDILITKNDNGNTNTFSYKFDRFTQTFSEEWK